MAGIMCGVAILHGKIVMTRIWRRQSLMNGTVLFTTLATDTDIQLIHREIMANSKIMSNPTHLEHIGSNIKELRRFRKLTQQELAEAAGLRLATISDIELGKANFQF